MDDITYAKLCDQFTGAKANRDRQALQSSDQFHLCCICKADLINIGTTGDLIQRGGSYQSQLEELNLIVIRITA